MKWFLISTIVIVVIFRFIPLPFTPSMGYYFLKQVSDSDREVVLKKDWESFENIPVSIKKAVIASEDQLFLEHYGFDFEAIQKAIESNEQGKAIRGGSTISQQTAKNAFLLPHRTYLRKGLEAYFTLLIELLWSKERILEVYLNVIEFGNGIYGVEAAAQHFFNKPASKLKESEAALLAAVLPNPIRYQVDRPTKYVLRRKKWILRQMRQLTVKLD